MGLHVLTDVCVTEDSGYICIGSTGPGTAKAVIGDRKMQCSVGRGECIVIEVMV